MRMICSVDDCTRPSRARGLCHPHYQADWRQTNPERIKAQRAKDDSTRSDEQKFARDLKRYKITPEQYGSMLEAQGGVCAICRQEDATGRRLSVDHSHETGKVRGLLCTNCNVALGHLQDNVALLLRAADYLMEA